MKSTYLAGAAFCALVLFFTTGCQKDSANLSSVLLSHNAVNFVTIENGTDSGTVTFKATTKAGFTAIVEQDKDKDSSAIDSLKLYYQTGSPLVTVDSSLLTSANLAATKVDSPLVQLVTKYFTFNVPTANLQSTKKYTVVAKVYTDNGNTATATFSNLFTW